MRSTYLLGTAIIILTAGLILNSIQDYQFRDLQITINEELIKIDESHIKQAEKLQEQINKIVEILIIIIGNEQA